jgi:hypothetical protein
LVRSHRACEQANPHETSLRHAGTEDIEMNQHNVGSTRSASGGAGKVAAKSHETAEQLKDAVVGQANHLRESARSTQAHASHRIQMLAEQLRRASDNLRHEDTLTAGLIERASRSVENVAGYVQSTTPQDLVRDVERLARRQPALFFGSALLLGLGAGRFLKSSAPYTSREGHPDEEAERGGPLASRQDRESGFFPSNETDVKTSQRYRENYDATFARSSADSGPMRPDTTARDAAPRTGGESPGKTAGGGERS